MEAAQRIRLAKGEAGINERPAAPTRVDFAPRFQRAFETLCGDKPMTVDFYKKEMRRRLEDAELSARRDGSVDPQNRDENRKSRFV